MRFLIGAIVAALFISAPAAVAATFNLLTGVDVGKYPGTARTMNAVPGPSVPRAFDDGDRLAGTADVGDDIQFLGDGQPLLPPNHVGAMSFLFRRGTVPGFGLFQPIQGIDYLGGPLLDLDGDLTNGVRRLTPVSGQTPVEIPGSSSFIDLAVNTVEGTITLNDFDVTGTSEGAEGFDASVSTTVTTIAGTTATGDKTAPINPTIDTREGTLTAYFGVGGALAGVFRVEGLGYELWYDSVWSGSSSASLLGTFQHLGTMRGWLVLRDCETGLFPTLGGQGLGATIWAAVDETMIGLTVATAVTTEGPTATIAKGTSFNDFVTGDDFTAAGNGGLPLADFGGDLGAYFDAVIVPQLSPGAEAFVYLESAGAGVSNSPDPVFKDTIGYDLVIVAETTAAVVAIPGDMDASGVVALDDAGPLVDALLDPEALSGCDVVRADVNGDSQVDGLDVQSFIELLVS